MITPAEASLWKDLHKRAANQSSSSTPLLSERLRDLRLTLTQGVKFDLERAIDTLLEAEHVMAKRGR